MTFSRHLSEANALLCAVAWVVALTALVGSPSNAAELSFAREILPLLSEHCFQCHGPDERALKAKLRLDTKEGLFAKRADGTSAVVSGNIKESQIFRRITSTDVEEVMPPEKLKKPLKPDQIKLVERWIEEGAKWGTHWAFEKPDRSAIPTPPRLSRTRNPIDNLVLNRLGQAGIAQSAEAPREILIRRVTLDLTGLPPTSSDVLAFLADSSSDAYDKVVDRLLASPRYGERMAWDWLDAARYADSNGYQGDSERTMWPWRDWVVRAFNENLPFDQFTLWQLAGDLLPNATDEQKLATGFCRNHMINGEGGRIPEENRIDYVMDMAETAGTVWLGLTLNCCRCHDHKYDPLTQKDYYRFAAFFNQTPVTGGGGDPQTKPTLEVPTTAQVSASHRADRELTQTTEALVRFEDVKFPRPADRPVTDSEGIKTLPKEIQENLAIVPAKRDAGRLEKLGAFWKTNDAAYAAVLESHRKVFNERLANLASIPRVMIMQDQSTNRETFVLSKGLYDKPTERVEPGIPSSLAFPANSLPTNRLGLAQWIVSPQNPLTSRVVVNRLWQQFFGIGLVSTSENFGVQAENPSNPELLDWLATEFLRTGWDVKALCRLVTTSATYKQQSNAPAELWERDPQNRLLARGPRFRMPSWMLRDQALRASGLLIESADGRPVKPYQPTGVWEEATFGNKRYIQDEGAGLYRRSLYTFWRRIVAPTMFFDNPSRQTCTVKQPRTNTPLQALATLNDTTYVEAAMSLAATALQKPGLTRDDRLKHLFLNVLGRLPNATEHARLQAAFDRYVKEFESVPERAVALLKSGGDRISGHGSRAELAALTVVCSTLFNLDETLTKP